MQVTIAIGNPRRLHKRPVIGVFVFSERETIRIFAPEPILVAFPPKPAPNTTAHHKALIFTPVAANPVNREIMAMVTGTLSTRADRPATTQMMITPSNLGLVCPMGESASAIGSKTPAASSPPTMMNRPIKKTRTDQSTRMRTSRILGRTHTSAAAAPHSAINSELKIKRTLKNEQDDNHRQNKHYFFRCGPILQRLIRV